MTPTKSLPSLIDAGQFVEYRKSVLQLLPDVEPEPLFEGGFAQSAIELSPLVFELAVDLELCREQIFILDRVALHLPIMSLVIGAIDRLDVVAHLRSLLLLVEADDTPYLLRFADAQMMSAIASVLTPAQRSGVFRRLQHWLVVDHEGRMCDLADATTYPREEPGSAWPLALSGKQTDSLIEAVTIPALASQLRNLESASFAKLSHAAQVAFATRCGVDARNEGVHSDELAAWALRRWREDARALSQTAPTAQALG